MTPGEPPSPPGTRGERHQTTTHTIGEATR